MSENKPMFDIEESEDVELIDNETSSDQLLKSRKNKTVKATGNKAGAVKKQSTAKTIFIGCVSTIIGGIVVALIVHNYIQS
ncbi:hypothetical protein QZQ04_10350 [Serratia marcescens]|uniref:hypothetical protein n=1 Tax=Serratia marcescens TaxID=615 RepID=UPI0012B35984|nr:hypothetical protein [Serratia marcescens]MDP8635144.1 hypothetical protein [Serratia marcescens]MDP8868644.1 hypothetical protein [Serratia marcescens]